MEEAIERGERTWPNYMYEHLMMGWGASAAAMLAADERGLLREYCKHTFIAKLLHEPALKFGERSPCRSRSRGMRRVDIRDYWIPGRIRPCAASTCTCWLHL